MATAIRLTVTDKLGATLADGGFAETMQGFVL